MCVELNWFRSFVELSRSFSLRCCRRHRAFCTRPTYTGSMLLTELFRESSTILCATYLEASANRSSSYRTDRLFSVHCTDDSSYTTLYTHCPFCLVARKTGLGPIVLNLSCRRTTRRPEPAEHKVTVFICTFKLCYTCD